MLTIALQRIEFDGRHGATAVERRSTRKFEVDVEMEVDAAVAERSDLLADTVDYSRVAEAIVAVGTGEPHHLLESLARRMLDGGPRAVSARPPHADRAAQAQPADLSGAPRLRGGAPGPQRRPA